MLIDWFTVAAQALNFLILVWLLQHFLYKPILGAIDARERLIAAELADADTKKAEADEERRTFQHKNEVFDRERAALLAKATEVVKIERQRLLDEARRAVDALRDKRQEALRNDVHTFNDTIRRRTQLEVFAIARKTLTELGSTSLEARISEVFIVRLRALDGEAKQRLAKALQTTQSSPQVRSAFDLPSEQQSAIQTAINETFGTTTKIRFETSPALVGGIELTTNGQKIAWSIADFLGSLESSLDSVLKENDKSARNAAATTGLNTTPEAIAPRPKAQHQ